MARGHEVLFVATSNCLSSHPTNNDGRTTDSCFGLIRAQDTTQMNPNKGETAVCGSRDFILPSQVSILLTPGQVGVIPSDYCYLSLYIFTMSHSVKCYLTQQLMVEDQLYICFLVSINSSHATTCSITVDTIAFIMSCINAKSSLHSVCTGPANCSGVSLTASRLTADSLVVSWVVGSCLGTLPTAYSLSWYPIGKLYFTFNHTIINASTTSYYTITGLSPHTEYVIWFAPLHQLCGGTGRMATISKTLISGGEFQPCMNSAHVLHEACRHPWSTHRLVF